MAEVEVIDSAELAKRLNVPETWVRSRSNPKRTNDPIPHLRLGRYVRFPGGSELLEWLNRQLVSTGRAWAKAEHRASTYKGYREIWENQIRDRIGNMYLREIRTVHVSRMLRVIAAEKDLTKTTLQHFKSVLSGIFTYAKNEGAFDGVNP